MTPNRTGRHFLQIPGPTNVPDRVLRAMAQPTIDHRSDEFAAITREVLAGLQGVFKNSGPVIVYPSSATGAWEAAFVNTLSPGDKVLSFEIGEFARLWAELARRLGLEVEVVDSDWTRAVDPAAVEAALAADRDHRIKAILVVHNETSTGATSRLAEIRRAIDRAKHPALYFVDAVSSLALDRSPSGRVGHRRGRRRIAERVDAAARHELQLDQRKGARGIAPGDAHEVVLVVGPDDRRERAGIFHLHAVDESDFRPCGSRCACCARKVSTTCSRDTRVLLRVRAQPFARGDSRFSANASRSAVPS